MFAADLTRAGRRAVLVLTAILVAGCATGAPAVDPSLIQKSAPNSDRPPFFVQWKTGNMPGLTSRPALDKTARPPGYPAEALRSRAQGTTVLEVCITTEGKLVDVKLAKSSGNKALDDATIDWAKTAKYKPAMFSDEAFAVCGFQLEYQWQLQANPGTG